MDLSSPPLVLQLSNHTTQVPFIVFLKRCALYDVPKKCTRDVFHVLKRYAGHVHPLISYIYIIQYNILFFLYLQLLVLYGSCKCP